MAYSNDYSDRAELSFGIPNLTDSERELLKTIHPQSVEYSVIIQTAYLVGDSVTKTQLFYTKSNNRADDDRKGELEPKQKRAVKLAGIIRYLVPSSRIDRDVLLFDCWSAYGLAGYKLHTGNGELVNTDTSVQVSIETLYHQSYNLYRAAFGVGVANLDSFSSQVIGRMKDYQYSPWLDTLTALSPVSPEQFKARHGFNPANLAKHLFGDDTELTQTLFRYHMTGAVKRTFEPGCQHDSMLILISPEKGLGKTSFLQAIARTPGESKHSVNQYLQMRSLKSSKSDLEKLAGKVIVNLDECDSAFHGLNADDLKEVITSRSDNYRQPYAKVARDFPRQMVLFGTSNKTDLIQDMNGDRRFFPVLVSKQIDIGWVQENWSDFWGYFKYCYIQGQTDTYYRNYVNKTEEALLLRLQTGYKAVQPWMETALEVIGLMEYESRGKLMFSVNDLLAVLVKETGAVKGYHKEAVTGLLNDRGYQTGKPKDQNGKQPGRPRLYNGTAPVSFNRADINRVYLEFLGGKSASIKQPEPEMSKVVEQPIDDHFHSMTGTQLDIFNIIRNTEIKVKYQPEPNTEPSPF